MESKRVAWKKYKDKLWRGANSFSSHYPKHSIHATDQAASRRGREGPECQPSQCNCVIEKVGSGPPAQHLASLCIPVPAIQKSNEISKGHSPGMIKGRVRDGVLMMEQGSMWPDQGGWPFKGYST